MLAIRPRVAIKRVQHIITLFPYSAITDPRHAGIKSDKWYRAQPNSILCHKVHGMLYRTYLYISYLCIHYPTVTVQKPVLIHQNYFHQRQLIYQCNLFLQRRLTPSDCHCNYTIVIFKYTCISVRLQRKGSNCIAFGLEKILPHSHCSDNVESDFLDKP